MNNFPTPRTENHPTGLMYGFPKGVTSCDGPFFNIGLSYESETKTILDYWFSQGYRFPSHGRIKMLNDTIKHLKLRGIWSQLDVLYLFATDGDVNCAFTNLINPSLYKCTFTFPAGGVSNFTYPNHSGVYGVYSGFAEGQTTGINTNFNPSTNAVKGTQDDNSVFGYFNPGLKGNSGDSGDLCGYSSTAGGFLWGYFGNMFWNQNESPVAGAGGGNFIKAPHFFHGQRISSSTKQRWINGANPLQTAATSGPFLSGQFVVIKNITTGQLFNAYCPCFGFGASLQGMEQYLFNTLMRYINNVI